MKNGNGKSTRKFYGGGLYLQSANGKSSWLFRYQYRGAAHWMGLGSKSKGVSLAKARQRAHDAADSLYKGDDPIAARREQRAQKAIDSSRRISFADACQMYYAKHEASWTSAKHRLAFLSSLKRHAYPAIGNMPVSAIDKAAVLKVIEPIWLTKNPTASNVLGRIESVLSWAASREYRRGDNPAAWERLKFELPKGGTIGEVEHHPSLPYVELPGFMQNLSQRQGVAPRALEFIVLTATRTSEVLKAVWTEFDFDTNIWTIPKARMKMRKMHRVPLSNRMIKLLKALPREPGNDLVFVGTKANAPIGKMILPNLVDSMGGKKVAKNGDKLASIYKDANGEDITIHGFRTSFKTWATEQTSYADSMSEFSLAHKVGDDTEQAYQRSDMVEKRRQLMEQWGRFVSTPRKAGTVTPIRAKAGV